MQRLFVFWIHWTFSGDWQLMDTSLDFEFLWLSGRLCQGGCRGGCQGGCQGGCGGCSGLTVKGAGCKQTAGNDRTWGVRGRPSVPPSGVILYVHYCLTKPIKSPIERLTKQVRGGRQGCSCRFVPASFPGIGEEWYAQWQLTVSQKWASYATVILAHVFCQLNTKNDLINVNHAGQMHDQCVTFI